MGFLWARPSRDRQVIAPLLALEPYGDDLLRLRQAVIDNELIKAQELLSNARVAMDEGECYFSMLRGDTRGAKQTKGGK